MEKLLNLLLSDNPNETYQLMLCNNTQFAEFVENNKDRTTEEIMKQYKIQLV